MILQVTIFKFMQAFKQSSSPKIFKDEPGGNFDDKSSRRAPSTNLIIVEPLN